MRTYDGNDIKYLLAKKRRTLSSVANDLGLSRATINYVIWGKTTSRRVIEHIERLLDMEPGTLKIARATNRKEVA